MNRIVQSHIVRGTAGDILGIVWGPREWCKRLPYLATQRYRNERGQLTNRERDFATLAEGIAYAKSGEA